MTIRHYIEQRDTHKRYEGIKCDIELRDELQSIVDDAMKRIDRVQNADYESYCNVLRDILIELFDASTDDEYDALAKQFELPY